MNISPETKKLEEIFQIDNLDKYEIPVYQRNYSWDKTQIEQLFIDIQDEDSGYYVGNLLIHPKEDNLQVIDGQQRLTTLSLLLTAIYLKAVELEVHGEVGPRVFAAIDYEIPKRVYTRDGDIKIRLLTDDAKQYQELLEIVFGPYNSDTMRYASANASDNIAEFENETVGKLKKQGIARKFRYIYETLLNGFTANDILDFYNKLKSVELLKITVPNIDDAYSVFASLNSKGLPLTQLDLLKNEYLSQKGDPDKWEELRNKFVDENDKLNENKFTRFIRFYYDGLMNFKNASSITKGKIVKEYRNSIKEDANNLIDKLLVSADIYLEIDNEDKNSNTWDLNGLSKLDASTAYPLILFLYKNNDILEITGSKFDEIIVYFAKFYVIRSLTGLPKSSNLLAKILSLKNELSGKEIKGQDVVELIKTSLRSMLPGVETIKEALNSNIYKQNYKLTRFILINLERQHQSKYFQKGNPDTLDEYAQQNGKLIWTVEHVLPQHPTADVWGQDMVDLAETDKIGYLGNLTLTPYNTELGNSSFTDKKEYTTKANVLVGLDLPLNLNEDFIKLNSWTESDIDARHQRLVESFLELVKF
ncbi:MAG: DUF262 domain-containing HNH endonuclease family protein [Lactobacillaceae bacterium]|nr:DUF262 domain-containing HNH endonuclease family protein [Lactobacillaceae bacterium]